MSDVKLIQVDAIREFPVCALWCLSTKTVDEVKAWALRKGARQAWYFVHTYGKGGILAVVRAAEPVQ